MHFLARREIALCLKQLRTVRLGIYHADMHFRVRT